VKILIAAMLPGLTGLLFAQLRAEAPTAAASPATAKVFTSPAGEFQIAFDPVLVQCARRTAAADDGSAWTPLPSCLNTVCEDADSPGASTLVCIAYPGERFSKKPAFGAAAFFVAKLSSAPTETSCATADPGWDVESRASVMISGLPAVQFHTVDHWMMHAKNSTIYRSFDRQKCFEFGIQRLQINTGAYDAGSFDEFTAQDDAEVQQALDRVLQSLRFTN